MLYHYTDSGPDILRSGVIRALPMLLYRDLLGRDLVTLEPVIWLTRSPSPDATVLVKLQTQGFLVNQPRVLWRFSVADSEEFSTLEDWAAARGHPPELFRWMLITANLAGSNYQDWRLATRDLLAADWKAVEYWDNKVWRSE